MKNRSLVTISALFLTACSSHPASYLPTGTQPIVNVESPLAEKVKIDAQPFWLKVTNRTESPLNVVYKLFWYDVDGVTQTLEPNDRTPWHNFWLEPRSTHEMHLAKPTPESANYRVYLRDAR